MVLTMNSNSIIQMEKNRGSSVRRKKRRDLRNKLGPTWSSEELFCFYSAYRKYGTDWLKVGAELHEVRTKDMLETLYSMNKTYLSLQEGIANAGGFNAIMVGRCKLMEESDNDEETDGTKGQVNEQANGKVNKPRCAGFDGGDDEKTISYSQVHESREQILRSVHQNESASSPWLKKQKCSSKPKYNIREGSRRSPSFQVSNPENNKLRKLLQEDERVGIACEALLELSTVSPKGIR